MEYRQRCRELWQHWASGDVLSDGDLSAGLVSDDDEVAEQKYQKNIGQLILGASDRRWPIHPRHLSGKADMMCPPTTAVGPHRALRAPGLTQRLSDIRTRFLDT